MIYLAKLAIKKISDLNIPVFRDFRYSGVGLNVFIKDNQQLFFFGFWFIPVLEINKLILRQVAIFEKSPNIKAAIYSCSTAYEIHACI